MSIQDDAVAFMKEIGLGSSSTSSKNKNKKQKNNNSKKMTTSSSSSSNKQRDVSGKKADEGKNSARRWGKGSKKKEGEEESLPPPPLPSSQTKQISWLKNHVTPSSPLVSLAEEEKWYDKTSAFDKDDATAHRTNKENLKIIVAFAEQSYLSDVALYSKKKNMKGFSDDQKWVDEVLKSGTLSDKVAALALQVQQSPPHEMIALDSLITLALKKEQRTSQLALEAIKDLLLHNLLPDRRLRSIISQPLGHSSLTPEVVSLFWYESELSLRTERIVEAIENGLKSTVEYFKRFCMELVFDWIVAKPEQEGRLLSLLVNKLGDPSSKICSKCVELLGKLTRRHSAMKGVVVREVRQLISRSNLPPRAVYSGVVFLSQISLSKFEDEVSSQLVQCYVSLFEKAVTQDQLGSKLLAALLMGINRAFPFLRDKAAIVQHVDALFRIVHSASFSTSTQALTLISHIALGDEVVNTSDGKGKVNKTKPNDVNKGDEENGKNEKSTGTKLDLVNRFYLSLYSKLLSDQILTRSHNTLFLNLLFRSLKRDPEESRVMAFVKRVLICATQSTAPIAAGLIFLVSEIFRTKPSLRVAMLQVETMEDVSKMTESGYWQLGNFDASKRDPAHACHNMPSIWETTLFTSHFHPSVQAFSTSFLDPSKNHTIKYDGDPTTDFSLSSFLNRFAYKNPKKSQFEMRRKRSQSSAEEPVNSQVFQDMEAADVAPEKEFFHKYFFDRNRLREEGKSRNRSRHKEKADESEDEDDVDIEDQMDKYADKLALDLMQSAGNGPVDIDDDDFSDDEQNDSGFEKDFEDDYSNGDDDDDDEVEGGDSDDDDMGSGSEGDFPFSDESEEEEEVMTSSDKKGMAKNKRKFGGGDLAFASAEDYEEEMESIITQHSASTSEAAAGKSDTSSKKESRKKMKRR